VLLLSFFFSTGVLAVNPIDKTLQLLKSLQVKIEQDNDHEKAVYRKYFDYCDDATSEKRHEIKTLTSEKARLEAEVTKYTSAIEKATAKIEETIQSISENDGKLKAATTIRENESSAFKGVEEELVASIDMLGRAIDIVDREMQKGGGATPVTTMLTQVSNGDVRGRSLDAAVKALNTVVEAAGLNGRELNQLAALLQSRQGEAEALASDDEETLDAPKAAAYETHSSGILDLMTDLREKAENQLREARTSEAEARHDYAMLKQSLEDGSAALQKEMQSAKATKSESDELKSAREGDLSICVTDLKEAKKFLEETQQSCMRHAADHEASLQGRAEELKVLADAMKTIEATTGAAAEKTYSFVQVASSTSSALLSRPWKRVVEMVRKLAKKHHSQQLLQLASRVAAAVQLDAASKSKASPFTKVSGLIKDMIVRLEKEATEEADEKAYCDSEMKKTTTRQGELKTQTTKLKAKIDQSMSASAKAMSQRKEVESEMGVLLRVQSEMESSRAEAHEAYLKDKADMQEGLDGVRGAIRLLREYYGSSTEDGAGALLQVSTDGSLGQQMLQPQPPAMHTKATGAGSSILGLLEVVESDLAKNLAEIETEESGAQQEYEQETQSNKVSKATMEKDIQYKTKKYKSLEKTISELSSDLAMLTEELDAVEEYLEELKKRCIAKPETFEERKARREAEIRGLQEALASLQGESASFLQQKRAHRHRQA
jgi:chromosome segregation ATPase